MLVLLDEPVFHTYGSYDTRRPYVWKMADLDDDVVQMINNIKSSMEFVVDNENVYGYGHTSITTYASVTVVYDDSSEIHQKKCNVRCIQPNHPDDGFAVSISVAYHGFRLFGQVNHDRTKMIVQGWRMPTMYNIARFKTLLHHIDDIPLLKDVELVSQNMLIFTDEGTYFTTPHGSDMDALEIMSIDKWKRNLLNHTFIEWMDGVGITIVDKRTG